ncbi:hypothetical protein MMC29_005646 [Sticta canariensis]|nr:hypothetical protein [Sticta canariensis]
MAISALDLTRTILAFPTCSNKKREEDCQEEQSMEQRNHLGSQNFSKSSYKEGLVKIACAEMAVVEGKTLALCRNDDGEISISKNLEKIFSDPDHPPPKILYTYGVYKPTKAWLTPKRQNKRLGSSGKFKVEYAWATYVKKETCNSQTVDKCREGFREGADGEE